jgi:chemotaxis protein histidine kinase CheA
MNMPIDRKDWAQRFPEFLVEAETLLAKSEECLSHLQLISNDKDAIDCMLGTLLKLAGRAEALALEAISEFSLHIYSLLNLQHDHVDLHEQALDALRDCLTLMAWQLELVDPRTGQLTLDKSEQTDLLEAFAAQMGQTSFEPKRVSKRLLSSSFTARQA